MATARTKAAAVVDEPQSLFTVDVNDVLTRGKMTGREVREFERVQPTKYSNLTDVFKAGQVPWDTILGIVYILRRRQDPNFSFDDLLDLTEDEFTVIGIEIEEADADPTAEPSGETPTGS